MHETAALTIAAMNGYGSVQLKKSSMDEMELV
jgi:hypothetical protein